MSFKGLNNELALQLIDWRLPPAIIRAFIAELKRTFSEMDTSEVPGSFLLGMNTNVIVTDPSDANRRYVFFVRFNESGDDFWVSEVQCVGVTAQNKLFWTPP